MPDGSVTQCYAKTVAEKFTAGYPQGFEHHYWRPKTLNEPSSVKEPSGIFVGSMADLFGHWTPQEQIEQVIDVMRQADWHIFQTLSKYPVRIRDFNPFPANVWTGVSLPAGHQMTETGAAKALMAYLRQMFQIKSPVRWMSIEPLWFDVAPVFQKWLNDHDNLPFEWAVIGAASSGRRYFQPDIQHVRNLLSLLNEQHIPIFFKGNLRPSCGVAFKTWREDFPIMKSPQNAVFLANSGISQEAADGN